MPVMVHGDLQGMLVLRDVEDVSLPTACQPVSQEIGERALGQTVCEHLGLAVSTLRLRQRLVDQAMRDPLTGLYNRRIMAEMFARELLVAERKERPLAIVMIDIDHFKLFNDRHGHEAGDAVLRAVATFLSSECRSSDVVCRYGGEEFAILLPEANLDSAIQRASRLREGVKKLVTANRGVVLEPVTISLGIAVYPDHGEDAGTLLRAADEALYQSKNSGRDRVTAADRGTRDLFNTLAWNDRVAPPPATD
jgi:diguanylate cyclase (GGDEF)-like protein